MQKPKYKKNKKKKTVENKRTLIYIIVTVDLHSFHSCKFGFMRFNNVGTSQLTQDKNFFAVWNKPS
jgi:hypothetical protein